MRLLAAAALALALAASPADYVLAHQQPDGGFAEPGQSSDPSLTAWAVLGLSAAGREPSRSTAEYLAGAPARTANELALRVLALRALGRDTDDLVTRLERMRRADGRIGTLVNSTIWGVIALRAVGRPAGTSLRYLLRAQRRGGGWSWFPRGAPDSNDTAAALQALRAAGVSPRARAIRRGVRYLRGLQRPDGGFALAPGRAADAQSTAWAIQALVATGRPPGAAAFRYLASLRREDGSYRYSKAYAATPVWVTSQVLPALARRPFPLQVPQPAMHVGFWPAITRRQSPPSPLPRLLALAAEECGLWLKTAAPAKPARPLLVGADKSAPWARDPETRRHHRLRH